MRALIQYSLYFILLLALVGNALAQDNLPANGEKGSLTVTGAASSERARFTAPSSVVEIRLEVYNSLGAKVFDNEVRGGNVLDWDLKDGQSQPFAEGGYVCLVTVKGLSGKTTKKLGSLIVEAGAARLQPVDAGQLTAQQAQSVGQLEEDSSLTIVRDDGPVTTTVTAHNGEEGQLVRGEGALSFRLGDFYRGRDIEQMRLTPEGNLGIGITHPQARLDVDGLVRASQGIVFPDGSIQYSAAAKTLGAKSSLPGSPLQSIQSGKKSSGGQEHIESITAGKLVKFTDNSGALGDSVITESSGNIGIGNPSPTTKLDLVGTLTLRNTGASPGFKVGDRVSAPGLQMVYGAAPGAPYSVLNTFVQGSTLASPTPAQFSAWTSDIDMDPNNATQFTFAHSPSQGGVISTVAYGTATAKRISIQPNWNGSSDANALVVNTNNNVGIGTTTPRAPLEVSSNADADIFATTFGGLNGFIGRSARGTSSSPSATQNCDSLSFLGGRGFGTSFSSLSSGAIDIRAAENFTDAAKGTRITFETTQVGSASRIERMRIDHDGFVGIGRSVRVSNSEVLGLQFNTPAGGMFINTDSATGVPYYGYSLAGGNSGYAYNFLDGLDGGKWKLDINSTTPVLTVTPPPNGNVGIGTSGPLAKLDLQGGADNNGGNDPQAMAFSYRTGGFRHFIRTRHDSTPGTGNAIDFFVNNSPNAGDSTAPGTGNVLTMSLAGGKVGIGTTAPSRTLDVSTAAGDGVRISNSANLYFRNGANTGDVRAIGLDASDNLLFGGVATTGALIFKNGSGAGSERMRIDSSGNVGVGATAPNAKLQVSGGDVYVDTASKGIILKAFDGSACFRLTVDHTGQLFTSLIACP